MQSSGKASVQHVSSLIVVFFVKATLQPPVMGLRSLLDQRSPVNYRERCEIRRTDMQELIYTGDIFSELHKLCCMCAAHEHVSSLRIFFSGTTDQD